MYRDIIYLKCSTRMRVTELIHCEMVHFSSCNSILKNAAVPVSSVDDGSSLSCPLQQPAISADNTRI